MKREKLTLGWRGKCDPVPEFVCVADMPLTVRSVAPAAPVLVLARTEQADPLDLCLELWKAWMAEGPDRVLALKTMRGLSGDGDGHGVDSHEAQRANDIRIAQATDAMIDSMQRLHIWAIYKLCSQATPWRFPNASLIDVGQAAREELRRLLQKNVCTAVLF
jgi:hypothetical protein